MDPEAHERKDEVNFLTERASFTLLVPFEKMRGNFFLPLWENPHTKVTSVVSTEVLSRKNEKGKFLCTYYVRHYYMPTYAHTVGELKDLTNRTFME